MPEYENIIGQKIDIIIDRPLGSTHPKYKDLVYPINYGYIENVIGGDGEAQDVYLLGVNVPVEKYNAKIIAVIHRLNDNEDKWVASPENCTFDVNEIKKLTQFQEHYFKSELYTINGKFDLFK